MTLSDFFACWLLVAILGSGIFMGFVRAGADADATERARRERADAVNTPFHADGDTL